MDMWVDAKSNAFQINSIRDLSIASVALSMKDGVLCLSPSGAAAKIPMTVMKNLGEGGLLARDITGAEKDKAGPYDRGPFFHSTETSITSYPAIHGHHNDEQAQMRMLPDGYYVPKRRTSDELVKKAWAHSGRVVFSTHWTFQSQACVCGMAAKPVLGGSAFPNFNLKKRAHEKAFVAWSNSVFGAVCFWFHSTRQQPSRLIISKILRMTMPVLDLGALSDIQLKDLSGVYEEFKSKEFKPLHLLSQDHGRFEMDKKIINILVKDKQVRKALCSELPGFYARIEREMDVNSRNGDQIQEN